MHSKHIPLIIEIIDNIVSPDERKRKCSNRQIMKILVLICPPYIPLTVYYLSYKCPNDKGSTALWFSPMHFP